MNSTKPKRVKLWKNSVTHEKKQKVPEWRIDKERMGGTFQDQEMNKNLHKQNDSQSIGQNTEKKNFKRKKETQNYTPNKKFRPIKEESDIKQENFNEIQNSQESEVSNKSPQIPTPSKKVKPDNMTRKEWKMLHLDKKSKSPKSPKEETKSDFKTKKEWKEFNLKKKGKGAVFEIGKNLKQLWEELRREDCKPEGKTHLLKQVCDLIKGHVKELSFAHDTVRVLECVLALGAENHRNLLFDELKDEFYNLTKSKYGKFFVIKMLKYGTKQHRERIMKSFYGKVIFLMKHAQASEVIEFAFNECANATQRFELIQEFFGANYKYFKVSDVHSLDELLAANPEKKSSIIENMKQELMKVLDKSVVKHSIAHHVLWQFMKHCDESSRSEIIESLKEIVPEILHTKDGSRVGMHCVWYGSVKDRKAIVKSMKRFVPKIAVEEHGHMVLLAIFDSMDDTKLVEKNVIKELVKNLLELSQNVHGKKVLIYLLNPRDPHFFHPDIINILKVGDNNEVSKKDPEIRRTELKSIIAQPLLQLIQSNIQNLYTDNALCLFTFTILQHTVGDRKAAFESIADLLVEPYTTENKNSHPIEKSGSSFLLKQLIIRDQNTPDADCYFSEVLINKIPKCVLSSWMECNRGAFLLVSLIETKIPPVVARIKEEMEGRKKYLAKKTYKGAEILLKKLKE